MVSNAWTPAEHAPRSEPNTSKPDGDGLNLTTEPTGPEGLASSQPGGSVLRPLVGFLTVFLVWGLVWWSPIAWLLHGLVPGGWRAVAGFAVVAVLPVGALVQAFHRKTPPPNAVRIAVVRPFWYVQLFLPFASLSALLGVLIGLPFGSALLFGRWALLAGTVLLAAGAVVGYWGTQRMVVRRLDISHPRLPRALDGLRIAQLSDLHIGAHTPRRQIERIRAAVRRAAPDLIVLTGDQVDDHGPDVNAVVAALDGLDAPLGIVAVPGNHDVYVDWPTVERGMTAAGYQVLVNRAIPVDHNGSTFWIAGTGDPAGAHVPRGARLAPDIEATMRDVPGDAFSIALAHNPALWPDLAARGAHLTLSGHTHHGQVSIPRLNWSLASAFLRYAMGHHVNGESLLFINPGTNYWGIPVRLGAWPEVTQITLFSGKGPSPQVVHDELARVQATSPATQTQ